jgi:hypothetical protein
MEVKGIIWVGWRPRTVMRRHFFADVLKMPVIADVQGFTRLAASNGDRLEFFGPDSVEHHHLEPVL